MTNNIYYVIYNKETFVITEIYTENTPFDTNQFSCIEIDELEGIKLTEDIVNRKEMIVLNQVISEMVYTQEYVKFTSDNSCIKIANYDFRKEGEEYIKITEEEYNDYITEKNRKNKIEKNKQLLSASLLGSDFIMLEDISIANKDDFKAYRAALRVLLASSDDDLAGDITLPVKPAEIWN
jgi:hypothetical protein